MFTCVQLLFFKHGEFVESVYVKICKPFVDKLFLAPAQYANQYQFSIHAIHISC